MDGWMDGTKMSTDRCLARRQHARKSRYTIEDHPRVHAVVVLLTSVMMMIDCTANLGVVCEKQFHRLL